MFFGMFLKMSVKKSCFLQIFGSFSLKIGADLVVLMTHWSLWGNQGDEHKMDNMYQYVTRAYRILLAKV